MVWQLCSSDKGYRKSFHNLNVFFFQKQPFWKSFPGMPYSFIELITFFKKVTTLLLYHGTESHFGETTNLILGEGGGG